MTQKTSSLAGQLAPADSLMDVDAVVSAYYQQRPDPADPGQRVVFGTNGHRGSSLRGTFTEAHILAIAQALCDWRQQAGVDGPLFMGLDTHALSLPAFETALQVLAANGVELRIAPGDEYTPTPAISHAIVVHNRGRDRGLADGVVVTPSHNPPADGGFKYNPTHGGPADTDVTGWLEARANDYLRKGLAGVRRLPISRARAAVTTREHDFLAQYVGDLEQVMDFDAIRGAGLRLLADPLGGAGVHYWGAIAERYGINMTLASEQVDARFAFMHLDWDGQIRMDPSSEHVMQGVLARRGEFDLAFACDTDHDRHGIVTGAGLMPANHYLSVMAHALPGLRPDWPRTAAIGKTVASSAMLERVARKLGRRLTEVPVGFKWFAPGLLEARFGLACEESAGGCFLQRDGRAWATDKDGIICGLLAAEIMARSGRDPAELYATLEQELGHASAGRIQAHASSAQKAALAALKPEQVTVRELAGEPVRAVESHASGNGQPIGGIKVSAENSWFAARPSGTEDIYKIYAETFLGEQHLPGLLEQAQAVVDQALATVG